MSEGLSYDTEILDESPFSPPQVPQSQVDAEVNTLRSQLNGTVGWIGETHSELLNGSQEWPHLSALIARLNNNDDLGSGTERELNKLLENIAQSMKRLSGLSPNLEGQFSLVQSSFDKFRVFLRSLLGLENPKDLNNELALICTYTRGDLSRFVELPDVVHVKDLGRISDELITGITKKLTQIDMLLYLYAECTLVIKDILDHQPQVIENFFIDGFGKKDPKVVRLKTLQSLSSLHINPLEATSIYELNNISFLQRLIDELIQLRENPALASKKDGVPAVRRFFELVNKRQTGSQEEKCCFFFN